MSTEIMHIWDNQNRVNCGQNGCNTFTCEKETNMTFRKVYTVCTAWGHFVKFSTWHGIHRHIHTSRQLFCWYQRMWLFQHIIHTLTCLSRFPLHAHTFTDVHALRQVHSHDVCVLCVCSILKAVTHPCVIISVGWKSHLWSAKLAFPQLWTLTSVLKMPNQAFPPPYSYIITLSELLASAAGIPQQLQSSHVHIGNMQHSLASPPHVLITLSLHRFDKPQLFTYVATVISGFTLSGERVIVIKC